MLSTADLRTDFGAFKVVTRFNIWPGSKSSKSIEHDIPKEDQSRAKTSIVRRLDSVVASSGYTKSYQDVDVCVGDGLVEKSQCLVKSVGRRGASGYTDNPMADTSSFPAPAQKKLSGALGKRTPSRGRLRRVSEALALCFLEGTMIQTLLGPRTVQSLSIGDMVLTMDHGYQPIRWVGSTHVSNKDLKEKPELAPVRIRKGAISQNSPARDLFLSPNHSLFVQCNSTTKLKQIEALAEVRYFLELANFESEYRFKEVNYYHILFDQHNIIFAEGAPVESMQLGRNTLSGLSGRHALEIAQLFPELLAAEKDGFSMPLARRYMKATTARNFCKRVIKESDHLVRPNLMMETLESWAFLKVPER